MQNYSLKFKVFKKMVWDFYKENRRDLPWRNTSDPYRILLSEIMLQQTQVPRVLGKYQEFLEYFPTLVSLAQAPFDQVLFHWSGLGYNRRALYLQKTAQVIQSQFKGLVPDDPSILVTMPGIGKNTAASIIVFSYNKPLVFIETNIRRVFIHHFFQDKADIPDSDLFPLIEKTLDQKNPREWYYALMDYGTYLAKTVENPNRKSRHYAKQSKFEGSLRQVRGKILKVLLEKKELTQEELYKEVRVTDGRFEKALEQLRKEHFIVIVSDRVQLFT